MLETSAFKLFTVAHLRFQLSFFNTKNFSLPIYIKDGQYLSLIHTL